MLHNVQVDARLKDLRNQLKDLQNQYDKSENDLKVGTIFALARANPIFGRHFRAWARSWEKF